MIATVEQAEQRRLFALGTGEHCEQCSQHFADAKKELGAFLRAFGGLFGNVPAADAAECWVELAESASSSEIVGPRHWRQITITAISRLSTRFGLSKAVSGADATFRLQEPNSDD